VKIALVRHPRPQVAAGLCYGRSDLPEHPDAMGQIQAAMTHLASVVPAIIWSSPALRCRGMAEAAGHLAGSAPRFDARLLEMDFGAWENTAWDDVPRSQLDLWAADPWAFAAPGGERGADLVARVSSFHADLVVCDGNAVIVGHAGPLKVLRALLAGVAVDLMAPSMPIGSVEIIAPTARPTAGIH
jgi:alpha-ribazole phosphatase